MEKSKKEVLENFDGNNFESIGGKYIASHLDFIQESILKFQKDQGSDYPYSTDAKIDEAVNLVLQMYNALPEFHQFWRPHVSAMLQKKDLERRKSCFDSLQAACSLPNNDHWMSITHSFLCQDAEAARQFIDAWGQVWRNKELSNSTLIVDNLHQVPELKNE